MTGYWEHTGSSTGCVPAETPFGGLPFWMLKKISEILLQNISQEFGCYISNVTQRPGMECYMYLASATSNTCTIVCTKMCARRTIKNKRTRRNSIGTVGGDLLVHVSEARWWWLRPLNGESQPVCLFGPVVGVLTKNHHADVFRFGQFAPWEHLNVYPDENACSQLSMSNHRPWN